MICFTDDVQVPEVKELSQRRIRVLADHLGSVNVNNDTEYADAETAGA